MLGWILRAGSGVLGRSGGWALKHPILAGTVAHVATDGKSTDAVIGAVKGVGGEIAEEALNGQVLERMGIPGEAVDMMRNVGGGIGQLGEMMSGMMEKLGPMLNALIAFLLEAVSGLMESMGINPASAEFAPAGAKAGAGAQGPQAIVQGNGRLAADLAANAAGLDPTKAEDMARLNKGSVHRVPHGGAPDVTEERVGNLTTAGRAQQAETAAGKPAATQSQGTALGNRGLNIDDVAF